MAGNENKNLPSLSPAEWEVMKVVWERGPIAARDVYAALPDSNEWAYKTVKTLLSRLVAKDAVDYDQVGNSYLYRAAVARDAVSRAEVQSVFQRVMGAAVSPVLAQFISQADLTISEIDKLKAILDQKKPASTPKKSKRGQS